METDSLVPEKPGTIKALSRWFEKNQRSLPWRKTQDPYRIWVSEVMLQQTQVATVLPYYDRFLKRFDSLKTLAEAPTERVLELWAGLGYYSRARNLQKGAQYLQEKYPASFPKTREEALKVPGIGPYTAGAVLSIAFDLPEAIVDGNVQRVLTRYYGWKQELESKATQVWLWARAKEWVEKSQSPRVLNQALMELGATVCKKENPECTRCPIAAGCVALEKEIQSELPVRKARRKPVDLWWTSLVLVKEGKVFLRQNGPDEWWNGLWSFPILESPDAKSNETAAAQWLSEQKKKKTETVYLGEVRHTVTHHKLHVLPSVFSWKGPEVPWEGKWFTPEQVNELALSSLAKKIFVSATTHASMLK